MIFVLPRRSWLGAAAMLGLHQMMPDPQHTQVAASLPACMPRRHQGVGSYTIVTSCAVLRPVSGVQIHSGWEDAVAAIKACAGNLANSQSGPAALLAFKDAVLLMAGTLGTRAPLLTPVQAGFKASLHQC